MFNQNATSGFGGGGLFGGNAQNTGGGFGGQQAPSTMGGGFGNTGGGFGGGQSSGSLFGGGGQNNATTGMGGGFGGGASAGFGQGGVGVQQSQGIGGAGNPTSAFGFQAQQQNQPSGFQAGGGLFGQQANKPGGLFGQTTQGAVAASNQFGGQNPATQGFGTMGGGTSGFGQQNQQNQQNQNPGQGLFGNQAQNNQNQFGNQNNATAAGGFGGPGTGATKFYATPQFTEQQLFSLNYQFVQKATTQDDGKGQKQQLRFRNIRAEDKYSTPSVHMLRLYDKMAQHQGQPQENPEWKAQQEWAQRSTQYPLLQKIQATSLQGQQNTQNTNSLSQGFGGQPSSGAQAQSSGFGGQSAGFGASQSQGFGGFGQTQQANPLFGGQQTNNNAQQSLFGQNLGQQNNQQTQGLGFGQQNTSQGFGGGFGGQTQGLNAGGLGLGGLNKPAGQGGSLFGQQPTQGLTTGFAGTSGAAQPGIFGQNPATTQGFGSTSGGGLFASGQNTAQNPGGGLFGQGASGQATGSGLFGQGAQQQPPQQPSQQQPGGLFGANSQSTGGLFGGAGQGGGLFSQSNPQQQQPATAGGLFNQAPSTAAPGAGGLFGQNPQQPAATGLFGQNPQPSAPAAGGLFGAKTAGTTGGGLFGTNPGASTGGLFGGNNAQPKPNPAGILGQQPNTQPSTGLFGSQAQPAGGLFGQGATSAGQKPPSQGLFGAQGAAGGGLFGNKPAQQPNQMTAGLFGSQATAQPNQGGLFGQQGQQPAQATGGFGLFNQQPQQPTPLGYPGATLQQQPNQQQLQQAFIPSIYSSGAKDPHGLAGGFLDGDSKFNPIVPFAEELEEMKREAKLLEKEQRNMISVKTEFGMGGGVTTSFDFAGLPVYAMSHQLCQRPSEADLEEEERYLAKQEMKQRSMYDTRQAAGTRYQGSSIKQTFSLGEGYRVQSSTPNAGISPILRQSYSEVGALNHAQGPTKPNADLSRPTVAYQEDHERKKIQESFHTSYMQNVKSDAESNLQDPYRNPDLIHISARLKEHQAGNETEKIYPVAAHKSRAVSDIWEHIADSLEKDKIPSKQFQLLYGQAPLRKSQTLEEAGITKDCEVLILVDIDDPVTTVPEDNRSAQLNRRINSSSRQTRAPAAAQDRSEHELCDENLTPRPPKYGYETEPSMTQLARMTLEQLRMLPAFRIWNEHGCIQFCPPPASPGLDLTEVDLASVVNIMSRAVAVYEELPSDGDKPMVGQKLNVPSIITLNKVHPRAGESAEVAEEKFRRRLEKDNDEDAADDERAQHISYDHITHEWVFKVPHFSRWGAGSDDEDDAEPEATPDQKRDQQKNMNAGNKLPSVNLADQARYTVNQVSVPGQPAFVSQRAAKPSENAAEYVRGGAQVPKYGSSAYHDKYGGEQIVLKGTASQRAGLATAHDGATNQSRATQQKPLTTSRHLKKIEILRQIKQKKQILSDVQKASAVRPANLASKNAVMFMRGVRPCFRPPAGQGSGVDCQLMTFHTSNVPRSDGETSTKMTLRLHSLRVQDGQFCDRTDILPDFTEVLLQHSDVQDVSDAHRAIDGSSARNGQLSEGQGPASSSLGQPLQRPGKIATFESSFYQRLFSETKIPQIYQKHEPSDIFQFLKDVAQQYINAYKSNPSRVFCKKLEHEFYVACMLNALFGDPRFHLIQLHPGFTSKNGMDNFKKATRVYAQKPFDDVKDSFETGKQRRNAVVELLRFICYESEKDIRAKNQKGNQPLGHRGFASNDEETYGIALRMLMNGDVVAAARLLSKSGKHNLALCISQAVSSQPSTKQRLAHAMQLKDQNSNGSTLQKIIDLVTGAAEDQEGNDRKKQLALDLRFGAGWQRALCSHLLYVSEPRLSLKVALEQFMENEADAGDAQVRGSAEDLLHVLLRLYVCVEGQDSAPERLRTFKNVRVTPETSKTQEFHVQWLVQHVLRLYSRFEDELIPDAGSSAEQALRKLGVIECRNYDETCSRYINQLIRTEKCKDALVVCLMIENVALKKRLIFDTLGLITQMMLEKPHQEKVKMEEFIHERLHLPKHLVATHMAVQNQYRGNMDAALGMWLELGHFAEAQEIFMEHLAPLYFGSPSNLQALRLQRVKHDLQRSTQDPMAQAPPGFRKSGQRRYVDSILLRLQSGGSSIPRREGCALLLETLRLLDRFERCAHAGRQGQDPSDSSLHWTDVLRQINAVSTSAPTLLSCATRSPGMRAVHKSISEMLLTLESELKSGSHQHSGGLNQLVDGHSADLQASDLLVSEQAIRNCANADLVRRAVDQTHQSVIPQIRA